MSEPYKDLLRPGNPIAAAIYDAYREANDRSEEHDGPSKLYSRDEANEKAISKLKNMPPIVELLRNAICPECDGSGIKGEMVLNSHGEPEPDPQPCEWCRLRDAICYDQENK